MQPNRIDIRDITRMRERGEFIRKFGDASARGGRMIRGVASTPALDHHNTRLWPHGLEAELPCPLLREHQYGDEIGQVNFCEVFRECVVVIGSLKYTPAADIIWRALDRAELSLSVGFKRRYEVDVAGHYTSVTKWRLTEISIVDSPANTDTWVRRYSPPIRLFEGA
jgi:hypothetical protein